MSRRWLLLLVTLAACEPLRLPGYEGEPRLVLRGPMILNSSEHVAEGAQTAEFGLFWNPLGVADGGTIDSLVEQIGSSRTMRTGGTLYWPIWEEPSGSMLFTTPSGARYGVAHPLTYRDRNLNGQWDQGEPLFETPSAVVVFAPQPLAAEDAPSGLALPAGFHVMVTPFPCTAVPAPVADGECGVPLGAACESNADCGAGICLRTEPEGVTFNNDLRFTWAGGSCAVPEPPVNGCRPRGGVLFRPNPQRGLWVRGCSSDADCERPSAYHCDLSIAACLPYQLVFTPRSSKPIPWPVCAETPP